MSRFVITVGGTGQHIALALTRLARMGAVKDLRLIALDSDTETALSQKLMAPTPSISGKNHPLLDGTVKAPFDVTRIGKKEFFKMFVDADHPDEEDLFDCLFDESEGSIPIHKGMYGTPCVGATVFAEGATGATLKNLLSPLADATQVFVCGSVVGGTGAGVMHTLIQEIQRYYSKEIFGIFMLPWFVPPSSSAPDAINQALINRNKNHGVKYFYERTIGRLTASLIIGHPDNVQTPVLRTIVLKEGDMSEHPSYLHLAAARALVELPLAHTANRSVKAYGMAHDRHNEGFLLDSNWETGVSLRKLIRALRVQHSLLSFLTLHKNVEKILSQWSLLGSVIGGTPAWESLEESIKNNAKDKRQRLPLCEQVLSRFAEIAQEAEFCVSWAQEIFPGSLLDIPNDTLMLQLSDAYKKGAESAEHWKRIKLAWAGSQLAADPNKQRTGRDIADHHANAILTVGLSS